MSTVREKNNNVRINEEDATSWSNRTVRKHSSISIVVVVFGEAREPVVYSEGTSH